MELHDIESEQDIDRWMLAFYGKLLKDPVTAPVFSHVDLNEHMPKLTAFWSFVLLEKEGYRTNVFERHTHLGLRAEHFDIWLKYFAETTDEMFAGKNAETAKQRVQILAYTFRHKLGIPDANMV